MVISPKALGERLQSKQAQFTTPDLAVPLPQNNDSEQLEDDNLNTSVPAVEEKLVGVKDPLQVLEAIEELEIAEQVEVFQGILGYLQKRLAQTKD